MTREASIVEQNLKNLVDRLETKRQSSVALSAEEELVLRLNSQFPLDIGIFYVFLLNYLNLRPGEALFLAAGGL